MKCIDKRLGFIVRLLKFAIVGGTCLLIDFGLTFLLISYFKIDSYLANAIGFVISASLNMWLNRMWTFESRQQNIRFQYIPFTIVALTGLLINTLTIYLIRLNPDAPFFLCKVLAVITTFFWNFYAHSKFTFPQHPNLKTISY